MHLHTLRSTLIVLSLGLMGCNQHSSTTELEEGTTISFAPEKPGTIDRLADRKWSITDQPLAGTFNGKPWQSVRGVVS